jgi:hypothetical protein
MEEEVKSLESKRESSRDYSARLRLKNKVEVQETKVKFFEKGYKFCQREVAEQQKLEERL